jgi:hypothetical protein
MNLGGKWEVQGDRFHLHTVNAYCLGITQENQITLNCDNSEVLAELKDIYIDYFSWKEVWTKH